MKKVKFLLHAEAQGAERIPHEIKGGHHGGQLIHLLRLLSWFCAVLMAGIVLGDAISLPELYQTATYACINKRSVMSEYLPTTDARSPQLIYATYEHRETRSYDTGLGPISGDGYDFSFLPSTFQDIQSRRESGSANPPVFQPSVYNTPNSSDFPNLSVGVPPMASDHWYPPQPSNFHREDSMALTLHDLDLITDASSHTGTQGEGNGLQAITLLEDGSHPAMTSVPHLRSPGGSMFAETSRREILSDHSLSANSSRRASSSRSSYKTRNPLGPVQKRVGKSSSKKSKEVGNPITSNPDYPSLYSAHGGGSCSPGYNPFPPSYASWEFSDPTSQPDQPTLNPTSNERDFSSRTAQTDDQEIGSLLLAWLQNEKSNESCLNLSHQMPSSLYQATPETIIQNMNPLDHGNFTLSESAATMDDNVLDTSQSPSSVPEPGEASVHGRRSERRSGSKNKGSPRCRSLQSEQSREI